MIVDLRGCERFPATIILEAQPGEIQPFTDSVSKVDWVQMKLLIQKSGDRYFCHGDVRAGVELDCARCARIFATELSSEIDFIIRSDAAPVDPEERGIPDDEEYVFYHGGDQRADVADQARQALVLAVDLKPLCQENCKGLCPKCGTNWNNTTCDCVLTESDTRWDGLKDLLGT